MKGFIEVMDLAEAYTYLINIKIIEMVELDENYPTNCRIVTNQNEYFCFESFEVVKQKIIEAQK